MLFSFRFLSKFNKKNKIKLLIVVVWLATIIKTKAFFSLIQYSVNVFLFRKYFQVHIFPLPFYNRNNSTKRNLKMGSCCFKSSNRVHAENEIQPVKAINKQPVSSSNVDDDHWDYQNCGTFMCIYIYI